MGAKSNIHDSAMLHVSGEAIYIDDKATLVGQLHGAVGQSTIAHGHINVYTIPRCR